MRKRLLYIIPILAFMACSEENISVADGNWSRFIYQTSDIATLKINLQSNPTVAFRSNYFQILGADGQLIASPKESLIDFDPLVGQTAVSLEADDLFVMGAVDEKGIEPVYGIKLMNSEFEAMSAFHSNYNEALFLPGEMETFYAFLTSPVFLGNSGTFEMDLLILKYAYHGGDLNISSSYMLAVTDLKEDQPTGLAGFRENDHVYLSLQEKLIRFDLTDGSSQILSLGFSPKNIFMVNDQVVLHRRSNEIITYDLDLTQSGELMIQGIPNEEPNNIKTSILAFFEADQRAFIVITRSGLKEVSAEYLAETSLSVDLLTIDDQWTVSDQHAILRGAGPPGELLWEKYELIAQDVREGRFAVFLFRRGLENAKYEYLAKRINF